MADKTNTDTTSGLFTLDAPEVAAITGRVTKQPGRYLTEVQGAIDNPTQAFGIPITEENKDKTIVNQLQKSAQQLGVKIRIYSRPNYTKPDGTAFPFVGFQFKALVENTPQA